MFVIAGTFRVDDVAAARPHMERMVALSRAEAGCVEYSYGFDLVEPTLIRAYEIWESRAAHAAHDAAPHLKEWRASWAKFGGRERNLQSFEATPQTI